MGIKLQDTIEKTVVVNAPIVRVYGAIAEASGLQSWFANRITGKVAPGETVTFHFDGCGDCTVYIEAAKPHSYFAYRWIPGSTGTVVGDVLSQPNTLVEFRLEEVEEGTRVDLIESGFASLPSEIYESALRENTTGWEQELAELAALFNQS